MSKSNPNKSMVYLKDYRPYPYTLEKTHLHFSLDDHATVVKAALQFSRRADGGPVDCLHLNGEALQCRAVKMDGAALPEEAYRLDAEGLTLLNPPETFLLETEVEIDPKNNTKLMGLYQSNGNFCTQCESEGMRRITYFPDRPDVMSLFTVEIVADAKRFPYLLSNGNLIRTEQLDDGRHLACWEDPFKKPCYLFALVGGDFDLIEDTFVTMSGRQVDLKLYLEKGFQDQGDYAMQSLKRSMKWDEDVYGREYDLDIFMTVAVSDFNFGAMENKGLNIFNTKYILAKPETATDQDFIAIEDVVGHEYFHNWSGDRVTCRDWFQITLKEGLTVFRDQGFSADMTSIPVERIDAVNILRTVQFRQDAGPMAHPIRPESYMEISNFYTVTVYNKGAEIIRMVQTLLGKETFREAMDAYFDTFDGQAVTTEDFIGIMESTSGIDLTQFRRWYAQAGTPVLDVAGTYDADSQTFELRVKQSCAPTADGSPKAPFHIPLSVALLNGAGEDMPGCTRVLNVTEAEQAFTFEHVTEKPVPSLLRHYSAPVKLNYPYTNDELAWLSANDNDPFNRWDAGQQLYARVLLRGVASHMKGEAFTLDPRMQETFLSVLAHESDDALAARCVTLPSEDYLVQQMQPAPVDAICAVRLDAIQQLAHALQDAWQQAYDRCQSTGPYTYNSAEVGRRALRSCALSYLMATEDAISIELASAHYADADNMTDKMAALNALNHVASDAREKALADFYSTYQDEPLVLDKWFRLQAMSHLPDTLSQVKALLNHAAYDPKNPNKLRALIGGFGANTLHFHAADGSGYDFLADQVMAVDGVNPMTAARLIEPLTQWRRFDDSRQQKMRAALERIMQVDGLSKDVSEVAGKSLAY